MKLFNVFSNQRAQSAVEYMLMFASVSIVVFLALSPHHFFSKAVNKSINTSLLKGTEIMAECVCYERDSGEPCPSVCGNGCCEAGESGSCAADCPGETYSWSALGWGPCSPECGSGTRARVVHCTKNSDGTIVSDMYCTGVKPLTTQSCSGADCNYYWREAGYGQCSVLCGPGTQSMTYECVRGYDGMVTFPSYCSALPAPPALSQACDLGQCCECSYVSACTDGSVPCCGVSGCGPLEHSEIQLCTPTGCIDPTHLQTQCTPHAGCCVDTPGECRVSPCGWNERKNKQTCGDGAVSDVCRVDNTCILTCTGTDIVEHGTLCADDDWGLMSSAPFHTVDACTSAKCEILCDNGNNYYADGGICKCIPPTFDGGGYVGTAMGAGGNQTFTSPVYSQDVNWSVRVWTEDLNYQIEFFDDSGNLLVGYYSACCNPGGGCGCNDSDGNIDSYTAPLTTSRQVRVYVQEGGHASSSSFGYSITGQYLGCD